MKTAIAIGSELCSHLEVNQFKTFWASTSLEEKLYRPLDLNLLSSMRNHNRDSNLGKHVQSARSELVGHTGRNKMIYDSGSLRVRSPTEMEIMCRHELNVQQ